jgi:hypothetical protein
VGAANCESKIKQFFKDDLELNDVPMLAACHPIPHPKNACAIVCFVKLSNKDEVLRALTKLKEKRRVLMVADLIFIQCRSYRSTQKFGRH